MAKGIIEAAKYYGIYPWRSIPGLWKVSSDAVKSRRFPLAVLEEMGIKVPKMLASIEFNFFLCSPQEIRHFIRQIGRNLAEGMGKREIRSEILRKINNKINQEAEQLDLYGNQTQAVLDDFGARLSEVLDFMKALRFEDPNWDSLSNLIWEAFDRLDDELRGNFQKGLYVDCQFDQELESIIERSRAISDFLRKFKLDTSSVYLYNELISRAQRIKEARQRKYIISKKMHESQPNAPILPSFVGVKFVSGNLTLLTKKEVQWIFYTPGVGLLADISQTNLQQEAFQSSNNTSILAYLHSLFIRNKAEIQVIISRDPFEIGKFSVFWRLNEKVSWALVDSFSLFEFAQQQNENWVSFYNSSKS